MKDIEITHTLPFHDRYRVELSGCRKPKILRARKTYVRSMPDDDAPVGIALIRY
jgi:hypothetical protein